MHEKNVTTITELEKYLLVLDWNDNNREGKREEITQSSFQSLVWYVYLLLVQDARFKRMEEFYLKAS